MNLCPAKATQHLGQHLPELGTLFGTESTVGLTSGVSDLLASTSLLGADFAASVAALPGDWETSGV